MRKSLLKLIAVLFFVVISCSLFLPQYETLTDGMLDDSFSFMSQYHNPDQSGGLFGGGFYTTFNGIESLNAILNVICSFFIMIMLLLERLSRKTLRYLFVFMIILHLLSLFEIILSPFLLSDPVRLKSGFYILRIMEVALFYVAYVNVKKLDKIEIEKVDLIDN